MMSIFKIKHITLLIVLFLILSTPLLVYSASLSELSLTQVKKLAKDNNNPEAYYEWGMRYYNGIGLKQNYYKAFKRIKKSSSLGSYNGKKRLILMYANGYGIKKDISIANDLYKQLAKTNNLPDKTLLTIDNETEDKIATSEQSSETSDSLYQQTSKQITDGFKSFTGLFSNDEEDNIATSEQSSETSDSLYQQTSKQITDGFKSFTGLFSNDEEDNIATSEQSSETSDSLYQQTSKQITDGFKSFTGLFSNDEEDKIATSGKKDKLQDKQESSFDFSSIDNKNTTKQDKVTKTSLTTNTQNIKTIVEQTKKVSYKEKDWFSFNDNKQVNTLNNTPSKKQSTFTIKKNIPVVNNNNASIEKKWFNFDKIIGLIDLNPKPDKKDTKKEISDSNKPNKKDAKQSEEENLGSNKPQIQLKDFFNYKL